MYRILFSGFILTHTGLTGDGDIIPMGSKIFQKGNDLKTICSKVIRFWSICCTLRDYICGDGNLFMNKETNLYELEMLNLVLYSERVS